MKDRAAARAAGRLSGIGVSTYVEICAMGPSKAMPAGGWEWGCVRMEISAKVTVITGVSPHGQGQETTFAQIVADRVGVPIEDVVVLHGDTNVAHYGRDTYGSRGTAVGGTAIVMCIDKIVAKAKTLAAHLLETTADHVSFEKGIFRAPGVTNREIGWPELAGEAYVAKNLPAGLEPGLEASSFFEPENFTFPFGTHIVAVEIDRDTGQVAITKYVAVDDCGPQINPLIVEGQVQGGIAHSIGQVLFEQTIYDENGQLLTGEFMDYAMPRARHSRLHPRAHGDAVAGQSARHQGRRRSRHDRRDAGHRQRRARRARAARHHASRSADDAREGLARHQERRRGGVGKEGRDDMYPAQFDYERPATVDEAIALLARHGDDAEGAGGRPQPDPGDEAAASRGRRSSSTSAASRT